MSRQLRITITEGETSITDTITVGDELLETGGGGATALFVVLGDVRAAISVASDTATARVAHLRDKILKSEDRERDESNGRKSRRG